MVNHLNTKSLEALKSENWCWRIQSIWNLTAALAAVLPSPQSKFQIKQRNLNPYFVGSRFSNTWRKDILLLSGGPAGISHMISDTGIMLTLFVLNLCWEIYKYINVFYHFLTLNKDSFLHCQYHGPPDNARGHGISSHLIDQTLLLTSSFSIRRVNMVLWNICSFVSNQQLGC